MQTTTKLNSFLLAGLSLLIVACNSSKKEEPANDKSTVDTTAPVPPPTTPPPHVEMEAATKRCFENDGLKYSTSITLSFAGANVTGTVTSSEPGAGNSQSADFSGTIAGDTLTVAFKGTAPVVGDASEWTHQPWILKKTDGNEKLLIVFNAKNYDTNKWSNTTYEFFPCKE